MEFHGAFYTPDSGQISIALEYMDGGSLADVLRLKKCIPEPVLSTMFQKLLRVLFLFPCSFIISKMLDIFLNIIILVLLTNCCHSIPFLRA